MKKKEKVLVAMSGGVDSSVAAALLLDAGYDVTGAYMINYQTSDDKDEFTGRSAAETCWVPDYRDAVRVAAKLGIPLLKLDFTKEYRELVLDYMYREYEEGRTPNPDVMCNKFVKFGVWLQKAIELGFDKLATGHYAQLKEQRTTNNEQPGKKKIVGHWSLMAAKDDNKDQTYFLHQLTQEQLSHVLFPVEDYTKQEVRELARKYGLSTAEKEESMGICFVGEVPMKDFLRGKVKAKSGNIINSQGEIVGKHEGLAFYTIGQRHIGVESSKLKVQGGKNKPLFIVDKRIETNELVVGYGDDPLLYKKGIEITDINWISGREPVFPLKCEVRLRHRQEMQNVEVTHALQHSRTTALVIEFDKPQRAVTPGQFAVFYKDGECLGGGTIT